MSARLVRTVAVIVPLTLSLAACEWFTDFKQQPTIGTWDPVGCNARGLRCDTALASRGNPQGSVPVDGMVRAPFEVSYSPTPSAVDSLAPAQNPTPITAASLENGRKYYQINCAVCHGDRARGDGPATKFGMPGINLTTDLTKNRTDGYIFGMIRNGRGAMPTYNRIEESDRWDVVNYVRALQGQASIAAGIGPLAAPGVTGDKLPGATRTAPTRPPPFVPPGAWSMP